MPREETNSITHLVKIVAKEVVNEEINSKFEEFEGYIRDEFLSNTDEKIDAVRNSCQRAGDTWTRAEETQLGQEVRMAIKQIAQNHQRSSRAIIERIRARDILTTIQETT